MTEPSASADPASQDSALPFSADVRRRSGPWLAGAAVVILGAILFFFLPRQPDRPLLIGVIGPLSGPAAPYGQSQKAGIELALDQINEAGGIRGRKLEAHFANDVNNPVRAVELAVELIYRRHALAIFGCIDSEATMNLQLVCERAQIPLLNAGSTHPQIGRSNHRYTFSNLADDERQAGSLARHTSARHRLRRVAVISNASRYGHEGARCYIAAAKGVGQDVVASATFAVGETNFAQVLGQVLAPQPEALVLWCLWREAALLVRQAREMGCTLPVFGSDGLAVPAFAELGGAAVEGTTLVMPFSPTRGGRKIEAFIVEYVRRFGHEPDGIAAVGFDNTHRLAAALAGLDPARLEAGPQGRLVGPALRLDARTVILPTQATPGAANADSADADAVPLGVVRAGRLLPLVESEVAP